MTKRTSVLILCILLLVGVAAGWVYSRFSGGDPTDNAGGKTTADFPQTDVDVFAAMDNKVVLTTDEVKGRNSWILWTAGNEQFWDRMARESYGLVDLLKTIDTRKRPTRFHDAGMVNEPGFAKADAPDENGLWLDRRVDAAPTGLDESVYGKSSGVVGLRLYPNPEFDATARAAWNADKFYKDSDYYLDPKLVRPYRVGMTCGFCHVAPNPVNPPTDPESPRWENLASLIGNQYLREGAAFAFGVKKGSTDKNGSYVPGNFLAEMLAAQPPGTSDTSRIATDHMNNPNTINEIFNVAGRLEVATDEKISGGALNLSGGGGDIRKVPHILKDGSDSIGVRGATIRVFVNIGLFHQQWLTCHNALIGLTPQKPFEISKAQKNSVYWRATEERLPNLVSFFLRSTPMLLRDSPGGEKYIKPDAVKRGRAVFAQNCAECHSSKQPPGSIDPGSTEGEKWFVEAAQKPDFEKGNFFSSERRYPITRIKTNAARAMGTNATGGHVWDNFSSQTYKDQASPGEVLAYNPMDESTPLRIAVPRGGQGYYRPPSLVSLWSSAPFFHNNSLGKFTGDPSVAGRMAAFNDACEKLLWPEKRLGKDSIWRTANRSFLEIERGVLPDVLKPFCEKIEDPESKATRNVLRIGPIPAGTPINLLANLDPDFKDLLKLIPKLKITLLRVSFEKMDDDAARDLFRKELLKDLIEANKCPDLIEDRGHEFGSELGDDEKRDLIEYLRTL